MTNNILKKLLVSTLAMATVMGTSAMAEIPDTLWEYTEEYGKESITMDFEEIRLFIPIEWDGLYGFDTEEDYVEFYQEESRAIAEEEGMEGGGVLFTLCYAENLDFMDILPDYHIIGLSKEGVYYITVPTDVQCLGDTEEIWDEWLLLIDGVQGIIDSAEVTKPGDGILMTIGYASDEEFIIPDSATRVLTKEEIKDLTADEAQMAINEIYARHGRKFLWETVRKYFESKSWYKGIIEANEFDPASMSYLEWQNIELLKTHMNEVLAAKGETAPIVPEIPETEKPEVVKIEAGTEVTTTVYLNFRELPSSDGKVLMVVPKGGILKARGAAENGWLPVAYETEEAAPVWGFVWVDYVLPITTVK